MEQQRLHQEDRVRRALERAQAEPKKKVTSLLSMICKIGYLMQLQCVTLHNVTYFN